MKAGGRRRKIEFFWDQGKEVEKVKEFKYLGYVLRSDNSDEEHIRQLEGKGRSKMGVVWIPGKTKFRHSWKRKMKFIVL